MTTAPALRDARNVSAADALDAQRSSALPTISVVVPVRNDAQRLDVCLTSLAKQNYPPERYEVIVVDNGSTDDSQRVALLHGAKVLACPGLRVGALRNQGVARARGELLAFIDSDHEAPRDWLLRGAQELCGSQDSLMAGAPCQAPPHGTWVQKYWELHRLRNQQRKEVAWLGAGNMFLRRSDFDRIGGFHEELVATEDVDLCVRFKECAGTIISDPSLTNVHHGEPASLRSFFWKELWRGSSNLRGFFSHGMPLHELPSLLFPAWHALAVLAMVAGAVALIFGSLLYLLAALLVLLLPSLLLAAQTSWSARRPVAFLPLAVLYFTYGMARAVALCKP